MASENEAFANTGHTASTVPVAFIAVPLSEMPAPRAPAGWSCPPVTTATLVGQPELFREASLQRADYCSRRVCRGKQRLIHTRCRQDLP